MPKKFYLIAHNPNTVDDVVKFLKLNANAIEPDVYFKNGNFYVMEWIPVISSIIKPRMGPLLQDYLQELQARLNNDPSMNLALILFDTKNIDEYDCNTLAEVIHKNFSSTYSGVATVITAGNRKYLPKFQNFRSAPFEAIGIDGGCDAAIADKAFQGKNYTFAAGTSAPLLATTGDDYQNKIKSAIDIRNNSTSKNPRLIYPWTVNADYAIRTYLRLDIDGLITDKIEQARKVMDEPEFAGKFDFANRGDNPF